MSVDNSMLSATDSGTNINMSGNVNIYDLLNGVAIRETSNGFYLLAKTGKLIGIDNVGVYAGTMTSTKYIGTF